MNPKKIDWEDPLTLVVIGGFIMIGVSLLVDHMDFVMTMDAIQRDQPAELLSTD